ncbi:FG-GAP-like repeat-containing protein [Chloroflexota bacterium]
MVVAADFNEDGFLDAAATDYIDGAIFWYENDGNGAFQTRLLDGSLEGAYPAHVGDVDLDGHIDILAAGYLADTFVWYQNDGSGGFMRHDIDTTADGAHSIVTGDMDKDGDIDLLTSNQDAGSIAWYENDGSNNFTQHIIDSSAVGAKRAEYADIDGDGDMDVFSASYFAREVAWHENDGSQGFTKHIITGSAVGAYYVSPADINGDGNIDVFSASKVDETIAWYENLGGGSFIEHIITTNAHGARTVIAVDVDADGDLDAVSASVDDNTVAWYENDGSGDFTTHGIDLRIAGAYGLTTADMDNDGDLDVLSAARDAYEAAIHAQIKAHQVTLEVGGSVVIDDSVLLTVDSDDLPADLIYTITDPPTLGELVLNGVPIPAGGTLTQEDINSGSLAYVHNGVDATRDGFSFTVQDGGENGVRPAAGTFSFIFPNSGDAVVQLALDEGAGTLAEDTSGLGNDGTLVNGGVYEADSGNGSAFSVRFDGVDDRIELDPVDVNGTGLTLAAWFKADSFPGQSNDPRLISKASGLDADAHVFMLSTTLSDSQIRLRGRVRVDRTTSTLVAPVGDLLTGAWQHAAMTYDGTTLRLYLDGVEIASEPLSGAVDVEPLMPLAVGGQPVGAGERPFDGLLDDVRILQRALSASEITALFTSTPTYTVTTSTAGNGTILLNPDQTSYEENTPVTVTAVPADGWLFTEWSGDLTGSENPATLTVDSNKNITATFVEDLLLTLTVNTVGNGTTVTSPSQAAYSYGETITITATADSGWGFDSWQSDPLIVPGWWDAQWSYRMPVTVDGAGYGRTDAPVEVDLNFTEIWAVIGVNGDFDLNSLRVVEVDADSTVLDLAVPFQFDPSETFDPGTNAAGTLLFLLAGNTIPGASRTYHIYFDDISKSLPAAVVSPLVTVADNVMDEGLTTYRINNSEATYYYDKQGGGFSSIVDAGSNDWINFNATPGSGGTYRGIPNLVYPEGYMHPGNGNVVSGIVHQGPLKATIRSTSNDGKWETLWEVYPDFARLTVLATDHNYWFLYEGTPGGTLDLDSDIVVRADGTQTLAGESWTGDLSGEEWVYFGDPVVGRSLYFASHQLDTAVDSYYAMNGQMTVFGFGRLGTDTYLNEVPGTFTLGLVDDISYGTVASEIQAAYQPLNVTLGSVEIQDSIGAPDETLTFNITTNQIVTATFMELVTLASDVTTDWNDSAEVVPASLFFND